MSRFNETAEHMGVGGFDYDDDSEAPPTGPSVIVCSACRVRPADVTPRGRPPLCGKCLPAAVVAAQGKNTAAAVAAFLGVVRRNAMGGGR